MDGQEERLAEMIHENWKNSLPKEKRQEIDDRELGRIVRQSFSVIPLLVLIAGFFFGVIWIGANIGGGSGMLFMLVGIFVGIPLLVVILHKGREMIDPDFKRWSDNRNKKKG